jgi:hypothetical protein
VLPELHRLHPGHLAIQKPRPHRTGMPTLFSHPRAAQLNLPAYSNGDSRSSVRLSNPFIYLTPSRQPDLCVFGLRPILYTCLAAADPVHHPQYPLLLRLTTYPLTRASSAAYVHSETTANPHTPPALPPLSRSRTRPRRRRARRRGRREVASRVWSRAVRP